VRIQAHDYFALRGANSDIQSVRCNSVRVIKQPDQSISLCKIADNLPGAVIAHAIHNQDVEPFERKSII
jgi:hypothetical protein